MTTEQDDDLTLEEIKHLLGFHKATVEGENATLPIHRELRLAFIDFTVKINDLLPRGRAKRIAIRNLEDASMWAHKATAEMAPLVEE